ncbi:unnamed protein product [Adineta steineri]|uniref:Uncharacterized protein n=1 Tax=Adineta steineri TaxID=433720 RepID=A0A814UP63_9BILA|nr:unnamed protein product [Adineta steineri]CAF1240034.1 unnamed protein product [Adineta steineri]
MGNSSTSKHSRSPYIPAAPTYHSAVPTYHSAVPQAVPYGERLTVQSEQFSLESAAGNIKANEKQLGNETDLGNLPSGYVRIHGGLKLPGDNSGYSSPLFVINLYKDEDNIDQTRELTGQASITEQQASLNTKHRIKRIEQYMTCTEELCIIPVEDIVAINYKSQFRKSVHHEERIDTTQEVEYKGKFFKKKHLHDVENVTNKQIQYAQRLVTIEIEYFKYVNPDSASIVRGLNLQEREKLDFEKDDYTEKQQQAELLCRAVVHLKTLRVYPSIQELPALFHQESLESLGHVFVERSFTDPLSSRQQHPPAIEMRKQQQPAIQHYPQLAALPQPATATLTEVEEDSREF